MKKHIFFFLLAGLCYFNGSSQNVHEYGLRFYNLNNFGLTFKTGSDNSLTRFSASFFDMGFSERNNGGSNHASLGIGASIGREKRTTLHERLNFVYGPEFGFNLFYRILYNTEKNYTLTQYSPQIGYILGLNYSITDKFQLSAELIPSIRFTHSRDNGYFNLIENSLNVGFSSYSALLTFAYRVTR